MLIREFLKSILATLTIFVIGTNVLADDVGFMELKNFPSYNNLVKSFKLRAPLDKNFYHENLSKFENQAVTVLTQVYIFGQLKSQKILPESVLNLYPDPTPEGILKEIQVSLLKLNRSMKSDQIHYYPDATVSALNMVFVMTQTISEFAPFLNLQDKELKKILVNGLNSVVENNAQVTLFSKRSKIHEAQPNIDYAKLGIKRMASALTPPNIFQKVFSKIRQDKNPQDYSQKEIGFTCNRIFN